MKRSDFVMKLMSVILFVAVAAYVGLYFYQKAHNPLKTEAAARYTLEETGETEGYIVRSETVLDDEDGIVALMAEEGEKLGAGQAVAVCYEGESALERASEICALQLQIEEAKSAQATSSRQSSEDTEDCILALADAVEHKNYDNLQDLSYSVKTYVFTSSDQALSDEEIELLELRLNNLLGENTDTRTVYTPQSGVFTSAVDGYEGVSPDNLEDLTPSGLRALFVSVNNEDEAIGKLISGITWYYAALMDSEDAQKLEGQSTATIQFTETYFDKLEMTIESIGEEEDGYCVVVFSVQRSLSDTAALRTLTAEVEFASYSGLYVPEEAVYTDDGAEPEEPYIYLLTGLQAEKVTVEILCQVSGGYIVRDGAENGTVLREGSEIIVEGEALYDGKVVK